jgi:hypothetical protein
MVGCKVVFGSHEVRSYLVVLNLDRGEPYFSSKATVQNFDLIYVRIIYPSTVGPLLTHISCQQTLMTGYPLL